MTHAIPQFLISTRRGGTVIVALGRLVLGHGARWGAWTPFIEQAARREVYVDLSGITQLDAAGLGLLVRVARRIRRQGRDFCIVAAAPRVRRMLALTRLEKPLVSDCRLSRRDVRLDVSVRDVQIA
jgi:anti-anti-sigma factor